MTFFFPISFCWSKKFYLLILFFTLTEDDYIYWVDITARTISRIKRDLTGRETIVPKGETIDAQNTVNGLNSVEGLAVDWVAGKYLL